MKSINWSEYTPDDFQRFCNAFLSFEFGKKFQPFSAPGRDGGTDGKFVGDYYGAKGEWRFQYKFHRTARRDAVKALKSEIKQEAGKLKTETTFILLTNIELLPQDHIELSGLFNGALPSNANIHCEVWDSAKIHTLLLRFPLLWLWIQEGFFTAQIVDYKIAFQKLLTGTIDDVLSFANKFAFRDANLSDLRSFVESDKRTCLITGEAGIGKTRLVIELFKQMDSSDEDVICLSLVNKQVDFDKLSHAFTGSKKILLLVDDAHEYDPKTISDLYNLVAHPALSVKLFLTAREIQSHNSIQLIKEYDRVNIPRIRLGELSRENTQQLLREELTNPFYLNFVSELASITHGKPILIVAVLKAAHKNMRIELVKEDDFLSSYVSNYFDRFIDEFIKETSVAKLKAKKILQLFCLLEPFNYSDKAFNRKMASFLHVDAEAVGHFLQMLSDQSFVSGRYEQGIKPDYYSDILLKNADPAFTEEVIQEFGEYIQNIITNLASADASGSRTGSLLDEILQKYIEPIADSKNRLQVAGVLDTVDTISYFKVDVAQKAVQLYIKGLRNQGSAVYQNLEDRRRFNTFGGSSDLDKIKSILSHLLYHQNSFGFVYNTVFELFDVLKDPKLLISVFQFDRRDVIEHFISVRQLFFIDAVQVQFKQFEQAKQLFAIECLKTFLAHDFTAASSSGSSRDSITITTYFIPASPEIKLLRKKVIDLLIEVYHTSDHELVLTTALETLLDIPRGISATMRNAVPYQGDDEIGFVLNFFQNEAASVPQSAQKDILDRLFWFKQWKINEVFFPVMDEIKQLMNPRNLAEELIQLFAQSENRFDDHKAEDDIIARLKEIYSNTKVDTISEGLSSVFNSYSNKLYNFHLGIFVLAQHFPALAMEVFEELWNINRNLVLQYGYIILNVLHFQFHEETFYWKQVARLEMEASVEADNTLVWIYGTHQASKMTVTQRDLDVIAKIARKKNPPNNFALARPLVVCVVHKPELGLELGKDFLLRSNNQEADHFFLFLFDNLDASYDTMKILALEGTIRYELAYNMERCLNEVFKREGEEIFYTYVMKRVERKRNLYKADNRYFSYELLPDGKHSHLLDGIDEPVKSRLFGRIVEWYCNGSFEPIELLFLDDLFEFFNRVNYLTDSVELTLRDILSRNGENVDALIRLLEILKVYHDKNEKIVRMVEDIYNQSVKAGIEDETQRKDLNFKAYQALTTVGVKSGKAGEPFQVDIDLKNLLEAYLPKVQAESVFNGILQNAIDSIKRAIESSFDRGNETW